jgi:hypothetical protein
MAAQDPALEAVSVVEEPDFKDFDIAMYEEEKVLIKFQYQGEMFVANTNVDASDMFKLLRAGVSGEMLPLMADAMLGAETVEHMLSLGGGWRKMQAVIEWLSGELGGSGN